MTPSSNLNSLIGLRCTFYSSSSMSYGTSPSNSAECTIVAVAVEKNGQNMDQLQLYLVSGTGNTFKKAFTEVSFVGDISKNLTRA